MDKKKPVLVPDVVRRVDLEVVDVVLHPLVGRVDPVRGRRRKFSRLAESGSRRQFWSVAVDDAPVRRRQSSGFTVGHV